MCTCMYCLEISHSADGYRAVQNIMMQFPSDAAVANHFIYLSLLLQPLQTVAKTAADHVRACVDRGVTDAVLNLAAGAGAAASVSASLPPSYFALAGGQRRLKLF